LQQHLHKFLILHHNLHIPGLGSFTVREEPARFDSESRLLFAPRPVIFFNNTDQIESNAAFIRFLAEEMGADEDIAAADFARFCEDFRADLEQHEIAVLPGVGRLVRRGEGELAYTPESSLLELLPPVAWHDDDASVGATITAPRKTKHKPRPEPVAPVAAAAVLPDTVEPATPATTETVTEEEAEEMETTTDRWWLYAILLLVAGILALLYSYQ
jgi:hypothetical protein